MKLSEFILLSENEKKTAVLHLGVLIGKRSIQNDRFFLFQLDSFYVEMCCNGLSKTVEEFRMFENTRPLQPYLASVPLDDLWR